MQVCKRKEGERLKTAIRAVGRGCMVLVGKDQAHHFQQVERDGNTYVVQDPRHEGVYHLTRADGTYVRLDSKRSDQMSGAAPTVKVEVHVKGRSRTIKKKVIRLADQLNTAIPVRAQLEDTPSVCLIDINRVMRICGFKKSFIYEQPDFPAPVRLGTSRRSAARWIESEVIRWATDLASNRLAFQADQQHLMRLAA